MSATTHPVLWGLVGRCPRCGVGTLFTGLLAIRPHCPACGLDLSAQDVGDGPVAFIILIAGFVVLGAALVAVVRWDWPIWLHLVVWLPVATLLSVGLMRPFKGALVGLQYRFRREDFDAGL